MNTNVDAVPVCAYCGLAAPRAWWPGAGDVGPCYCCYGCRFAAQVSSADGQLAEARGMFTRLGLAIFCTMNVMAFTMALWSSDVYGDENAAAARPLFGIFRYLSMIFAIPVFYSLGLPLLENAWDSLRRGVANIDVLLIAGVTASYLFSAYSVFRDEGAVYFEVGCVVLVLVTLGRWLEATGKARASRSLDALEKLLPERVCVLRDAGEVEIARTDVAVGARLHVRAGERIPCDGMLLDQAANVDEQLLTGESVPHVKEPGAAVHAGTLNLDGDLMLEVTSTPESGALARLVRLVRQAQHAKGRYEQLADRIAAWFVPMVAVIALATAIYHGIETAWQAGILAGLSVILIACPCALGIATPLAMWSALGRAAQQRVLFHGGDVLERLAIVEHVCFDKTGTLTTGAPVVECVLVAHSGDERGLLERAAALAAASRHVHSQAIVDFLRQRHGIEPEIQPNVRTHAGRGLQADSVFLGSRRWMDELGMIVPEEILGVHPDGHAFVYVAWDGHVRGRFVLAESWRPEASKVLNELTCAGIGVTILTGDANLREVPWQARKGLLPEEKLGFLEDLRQQGKVVAMVGDGINDGPALAASDVGIAMGCGADVARDAAGVCLLDSDLGNVVWAIELARQTMRVIRQNLFWAFAYNIVGIALACAGKLNPVIAALTMALSSMFVLVNSLRLATHAESPKAAPSESPQVALAEATP